MPELPEVETIKRDLNRYLKGKTIEDVEIRLPKLLNLPPAEFQKALVGRGIDNVRRRAKMLVFELAGGQCLLVHLKLTGQLIYRDSRGFLIKGGHNLKGGEQDLPNKYTHVIFECTDSSHLFYNDLRQFGWLKLVDQAGLSLELAKLGPEPLGANFTREKFEEILEKNSKVQIKPLLMNQAKVAGLGNIYADEVCFYARVRPTRVDKTLTESERQRLFLGIKKILKAAIAKRGTSADSYVDARGRQGGYLPYLKVYGRDGQKCLRCGTAIKKVRLASRGTHFCPHCQR